jgi:hypothetical protein
MAIINSLINWFITKRVHDIELVRKYPLETQQETLLKLLDKASNTEWGKKYHYNEIRTIREYQQRVPLQTYDEIKPFVDRLRRGEKNLLWPSEIRWFAKSSGTTNDKSKFIPVSEEALEECHIRGGKDVIAMYTDNYPETKLLYGKGLTLGGSHQIDNFSNQSYYGDLSAILIENLPWWADFIRTPKSEIVLIPKFEEKLEKILETTRNENVTNLAGVPSWTMVMIRYILERTGKNNLLEIWPNLELFIHGGISFTPYREQYKKLIPSSSMHYMETYNASEGFFAMQDDPLSDDMLLMLDYGIFYEFIPMDEFHSDNPRALSISEVRKGINYAMVISTNAGLWRYIIGDTVIFTSVSPYKIKISGRTRHFINVFGEEVIVNNTDKALKTACEKTDALISEYTVAPRFMDIKTKGTHEWVIEFERPPANLAFFVDILDNALKSQNSDYEAKRYNNITLELPIVHAVIPGTFYRWFTEKGKVGGQNKMPRLSNERKYVEEILAFADKNK